MKIMKKNERLFKKYYAEVISKLDLQYSKTHYISPYNEEDEFALFYKGLLFNVRELKEVKRIF